ncbi:uncharacterized protein JCM6883_004738 [Sporobolomyces salmoneus]|uniref:uncharacterized protein n=1 Tax=Sporobolomyces salmoneus TaxID=183962 RepID=UPI003178F114
MKIKTMHRSIEQHLPSTSTSSAPVSRNLDPSLHPFARSREYKRAVTASKLDRMFAKPFVASLEGHQDGIYSLVKDEFGSLSRIATGSGDGEVRVWDLSRQSTVWSVEGAHERGAMVKGLCFSHPMKGEENRLEKKPAQQSSDGKTREKSLKRKRTEIGYKGKGRAGYDDELDELDDEEYQTKVGKMEEMESRGSNRVLSCSTDKTVKLWDINGASGKDARPLQTYHGKSGFNAISHHRYDPLFAAASHSIEIFDETKTSPISTLKFHSTSSSTIGEHIVSVAFNKSETNVLASSGSDRTVVLYDLRSGKALGRVAMQMRINQLSFNPLQPPILLCASEDHNLYTFDMRNLSTTTQVYKGHVGAVMSADWSPTGREFVSGSYDRTVRLWESNQGSSRDIYHTKRMQRVFSTAYTLDTRFVLSGSDDGNLRIWKSSAGEKIGVIDKKEQVAREYRTELRNKWGQVAEVSKIERQRYLPKPIHQATKLRREMLDAANNKEENRRKHAPKGIDPELLKPKAQRKVAIQKVES